MATDEANIIIKGKFNSELEYHNFSDESKYQFSVGYPSQAMVDRFSGIMKAACEQKLTEESKTGNHLFYYGLRMGDPLFRCQLAKFLSKHYGYEVKWESILATAGATSGLYFICSFFFGVGDIVFAEEPSYFIALDMMKVELNRKVVQVPIDDDGIIPEDLERSIQEHYPEGGFVPSKERLYWSMLYIIPCFQNPSGVVLTEDRCKKVVHLARKYHILVVSEDLYFPLRWGSRYALAPKQLKYFDKEDDPDYVGNVISNNSFSKFMAPGLRLGWIDAPQVVLEKFVLSSYFDSAGDFNHFTSGLVGKVLESDLLHEHIEEACREYKKKLECMQSIFDDRLKGIIKYTLPHGGYFVWIELPVGMHCQELAKLCREKYDVSFSCGTMFTKIEGNLTNFIRIAFSLLEHDMFVKGIENIATGILDLHGQIKSSQSIKNDAI